MSDPYAEYLFHILANDRGHRFQWVQDGQASCICGWSEPILEVFNPHLQWLDHARYALMGVGEE